MRTLRRSWIISITVLTVSVTAEATDVDLWLETIRVARERVQEGKYEQAETLLVRALDGSVLRVRIRLSELLRWTPLAM